MGNSSLTDRVIGAVRDPLAIGMVTGAVAAAPLLSFMERTFLINRCRPAPICFSLLGRRLGLANLGLLVGVGCLGAIFGAIQKREIDWVEDPPKLAGSALTLGAAALVGTVATTVVALVARSRPFLTPACKITMPLLLAAAIPSGLIYLLLSESR